ncbi:unnamed protein product [Adineta ricciae]|uniref:Kinesin light chain n=1 Tax=Adineta ricciae TaxID=249248 RepID=A0A814AHD8_ADIRI|nr:unnamed protein product [Adineta ricciae]
MGANKSSNTKDADEPSLPGSTTTLDRRCISVLKAKNAVLICLNDNNTSNEKSKNWQQVIAGLQRVVTTIITYSDIEQCFEFINGVNYTKVCIVLPGSLGQQFVPRIHNLSQVDSILIYSENKPDDEQWSKGLSKVQGVFTEVSTISEALKQAARNCEQNAMPVSLLGSNKNFSQLDFSFVYIQIVKEIIFARNYDDKDMKEFISNCRELFADSPDEMTQIKEFESKYRSETPIWWYTKDCYIRPMLDRALRMMNAEILTHISFFIVDLYKQIEELHKEQHQAQSTTLTVYCAQGLSKADFEQVKKCQRGLMSFNSFLLTNKVSKPSLDYAQNVGTKGDTVGIMFVIKIEPSQSNPPFASISTVSYSHAEGDILFAMHSTFRITDIKRLTANNRLQEVYLTPVGNNDKDLTVVKNTIRQETFPDKQGWARLAEVLVKLNYLDQAEHIYLIVLNQTEEMNEKANIFHQLCAIKEKQERYAEAATFYEQLAAFYRDNPPSDQLELANVYFSLGATYSKLGNFPKALAAHKEAVKIREKSLPAEHLDLAKSYETLSSIYTSMGDYQEALPYLEKDLAINQKLTPSNHAYLIKSCMNIGMVCFSLQDYPKALSYYEKVLEIQTKTLPANHRDFAKTYNNLGAVHNSMSEYQKGLVCHEKALAIREKTLPSNHPDFGTSYNNIGVTYENMGDYTKACTFFERAIQFGERTLPADHPALQVRRDNLARVKQLL